MDFCFDFSFGNLIEPERGDNMKTGGFSKAPAWIFLVLDARNDLQYANIILQKIWSAGALQILTDLMPQSVA